MLLGGLLLEVSVASWAWELKTGWRWWEAEDGRGTSAAPEGSRLGPIRPTSLRSLGW